MRRLILAPALLLAAASGAAPPAEPDRRTTNASAAAGAMPMIAPGGAPRSECPAISRYHAQRQGGRPSAEYLSQLPDADMYKTAYRVIRGCEAPIIASYGVAARKR